MHVYLLSIKSDKEIKSLTVSLPKLFIIPPQLKFANEKITRTRLYNCNLSLSSGKQVKAVKKTRIH